jgi:hypothetical protein
VEVKSVTRPQAVQRFKIGEVLGGGVVVKCPRCRDLDLDSGQVDFRPLSAATSERVGLPPRRQGWPPLREYATFSYSQISAKGIVVIDVHLFFSSVCNSMQSLHYAELALVAFSIKNRGLS